MDYVEGGTLRDLATRLAAAGENRLRAMVRILLDTAAGLEAAHRATDEDGRPLGIVHRDVSPSNVLVGLDGVTRISDFGIAKAEERSGEKTETGVLKGKFGYMAPEYVEHQRADAATDQFALGVVAWEAFAGERLFRAPTELETLKRVVAARIPPLASIRPELAPLDAVIARALARVPSERYPTVGAFAIELEEVARAHELVGSHAEVAALVSELFGEELTERRRLLRAAPSLPVQAPPSVRDGVDTASLLSRVHAVAPLWRRMYAAIAIAFIAMMIGVVVVAMKRAPTDRPASAATSVASSEAPAPRSSEAEPPAAGEMPGSGTSGPSATSSSSSSSSRGARRTPAAKTSPTAAPPGLLPKKAPPNPYPSRP
jgi:serine/threonine protein kinase